MKQTILHHSDPEERQEAIARLQANEDKDTRDDVLVGATTDRSVAVRCAASEALRDYADSLSANDLRLALYDPGAEARLEALQVLDDLEDKAEAAGDFRKALVALAAASMALHRTPRPAQDVEPIGAA